MPPFLIEPIPLFHLSPWSEFRGPLQLPESTLSVEVRCPSGHVVLVPACDVASLTSLFAALDPLAPEARSC